MNPYYELDGCTIYHGDCRDILPRLQTVDLVLTDPPYNVGKQYGAHNDAMTPSEYKRWSRGWFKRCERLANRHVVIFPGHGNLGMWLSIQKPDGIGCWNKPGNPARGGGVFQFCEWEPYIVYGKKPIGKSDVITAPVTRQADVGNHPCPKPLKLFRSLLARLKSQSVIDPFMGSGTTLVAAKAFGMQAVGIEIEEQYCEIAARRLAQQVLFTFTEVA